MTVEKATPAKAAELTQDPPRARDGPEKTLEVAIGRALRGFRRRQEVTVAELASR
ncbi:MAG: MerR family transcriptional regulator, partial [Planktomarina temperata]|nr:MerR family transcriptional regulator [Planktomarina temperata]